MFQKGFEIARLANLKPGERDEYKQSVKNYLDMMNVIETARKDGMKKGKKEHAIEVAMAMIKDLLPVDHIVKYIGLTKSEVEKLVQEMK